MSTLPDLLTGYLCAVPTLHNHLWQPDTGLFNFVLFNPPNSPIKQALFLPFYTQDSDSKR